MAKKVAVPQIGAAFGGGFYVGSMELDGVKYALVVSPKAQGEKMGLQYKKSKLSTADGADADDDGFYNSCLLDNANHPAAHFCISLQIGEYDDWYLPSRDELMLIWMALGPNRNKIPDLFKAGAAEALEGKWYWSSTEFAQYSDDAWIVGFTNGGQDYYDKGYDCGVRAVRRLKL
jgi:hypothetical protein